MGWEVRETANHHVVELDPGVGLRYKMEVGEHDNVAEDRKAFVLPTIAGLLVMISKYSRSLKTGSHSTIVCVVK